MKCWRAHVPLERESGKVKVAASRLMNYTAARAIVVEHSRRGGGVGFVDRDERAFKRASSPRPPARRTRSSSREQLELRGVA